MTVNAGRDRGLFVEQFLVVPLEPDCTEPPLRYDEQRHLNVLADGRAFIETGGAGLTQTLTEVRAEQDDFDRPDDDAAALSTLTKIRREGDDMARDVLLFATETRQVPGEREDFARDERVHTRSTLADRARACAAALAVTKTEVRREADDFSRTEDDEDAAVVTAAATS
jgi:hypothetical protein